MAHQELQAEPANVQALASYKVISYPGTQLPNSYRNLIFSKWLRSLRFGNEYFKLIDSESYYTTYHKYIEALISKPDAVIRLAVLSDDADVVLGFSVSRGTTLDYVHVHKDCRKQGIGTSLVPQGITAVSHLTNIGMAIWSAKLSSAIFNPFA